MRHNVVLVGGGTCERSHVKDVEHKIHILALGQTDLEPYSAVYLPDLRFSVGVVVRALA